MGLGGRCLHVAFFSFRHNSPSKTNDIFCKVSLDLYNEMLFGYSMCHVAGLEEASSHGSTKSPLSASPFFLLIAAPSAILLGTCPISQHLQTNGTVS